jgi:hypothetical protein
MSSGSETSRTGRKLQDLELNRETVQDLTGGEAEMIKGGIVNSDFCNQQTEYSKVDVGCGGQSVCPCGKLGGAGVGGYIE